MTPDSHTEIRDLIKSRLDQFPALNLHLVSAHCNGGALTLSEADALDEHKHEHDGPGTIRNHPREDLFYDADKIADIIIETAEYDDPAELSAEVERLLTLPDTTVGIAAGEHAHTEDVRTWDGRACPDGVACAVYPRVYDLKVVRSAAGEFKGGGFAKIDNSADDIARGLLAARDALAFADALATDERCPHPALASIVADAEARLRNSIAMLHPHLYPRA